MTVARLDFDSGRPERRGNTTIWWARDGQAWNSMDISALTKLLTEPETFDAKLVEMRVPLPTVGVADPMAVPMPDAAPVEELREASE